MDPSQGEESDSKVVPFVSEDSNQIEGHGDSERKDPKQVNSVSFKNQNTVLVQPKESAKESKESDNRKEEDLDRFDQIRRILDFVSL